jgi:hypothetical protein
MLIVLTLGLLAADGEKPATVRYLRPAQGKLVLESEVTRTTTADGMTYVSRTDRGAEKMTLTLRHDKDGRLTSAEAVQESAAGKKSALLTLRGDKAELRRGDTTETLPAPAALIVTTAPDWTDIFELVRRYDGKKAGKQEFAGLWIHPVQPTRQLTFTVERVGKDTAQVEGREVPLDRYAIRLRSGDYLAWGDRTGRVVRLIPAGKPAAAVVLEGFAEATRALGDKP